MRDLYCVRRSSVRAVGLIASLMAFVCGFQRMHALPAMPSIFACIDGFEPKILEGLLLLLGWNGSLVFGFLNHCPIPTPEFLLFDVAKEGLIVSVKKFQRDACLICPGFICWGFIWFWYLRCCRNGRFPCLCFDAKSDFVVHGLAKAKIFFSSIVSWFCFCQSRSHRPGAKDSVAFNFCDVPKTWPPGIKAVPIRGGNLSRDGCIVIGSRVWVQVVFYKNQLVLRIATHQSLFEPFGNIFCSGGISDFCRICVLDKMFWLIGKSQRVAGSGGGSFNQTIFQDAVFVVKSMSLLTILDGDGIASMARTNVVYEEFVLILSINPTFSHSLFLNFPFYTMICFKYHKKGKRRLTPNCSGVKGGIFFYF